MFMNRLAALAPKLFSPLIFQVTVVPSPVFTRSRSVRLCASKGVMKSRSMPTCSLGFASVIFMFPSPTSLLPTQW